MQAGFVDSSRWFCDDEGGSGLEGGGAGATAFEEALQAQAQAQAKAQAKAQAEAQAKAQAEAEAQAQAQAQGEAQEAPAAVQPAQVCVGGWRAGDGRLELRATGEGPVVLRCGSGVRLLARAPFAPSPPPSPLPHMHTHWILAQGASQAQGPPPNPAEPPAVVESSSLSIRWGGRQPPWKRRL